MGVSWCHTFLSNSSVLKGVDISFSLSAHSYIFIYTISNLLKFIEKLGMKLGEVILHFLWVEPKHVGIHCKNCLSVLSIKSSSKISLSSSRHAICQWVVSLPPLLQFYCWKLSIIESVREEAIHLLCHTTRRLVLLLLCHILSPFYQ